jgi:hypothetical protein
MINGPGKYSVNIATPGVTIRGTDGAPLHEGPRRADQRTRQHRDLRPRRRRTARHGACAAERGRYPAINVLQPVSRTMPRAADQAYLPVLTRARQVMAIYADMEEHSARSLSCRDRPPRSTRLSGCTSRSKLFLPKVRKKQPAWRKDTVGWPKSWPPRKPNANVIAP